MNDDASSSPASYIRLVQHLIEKCICYKLNKEECMETLEKHAKIMPVITSTVWKELEKENREFFETYKKDRGGGGPNPNQEAATTGHHPSRVQQSCCSQASTTTLQKNPSGEQEQRVVENKENRKNPSHEQEQRVVEKEKRKNPSASKSSGDDDNQNSRSVN
ncbi:unnamed protein product [Miscanthus lutarioriparius]|uniref:Uncharacterized protein n=1 Tax=Miscanthus lutarioriparius TaxID=422564 RepID=A0A811NW63_9POAL|nr:unnamed protein product [Miscanthus lutarioriparius]